MLIFSLLDDILANNQVDPIIVLALNIRIPDLVD